MPAAVPELTAALTKWAIAEMEVIAASDGPPLRIQPGSPLAAGAAQGALTALAWIDTNLAPLVLAGQVPQVSGSALTEIVAQAAADYGLHARVSSLPRYDLAPAGSRIAEEFDAGTTSGAVAALRWFVRDLRYPR